MRIGLIGCGGWGSLIRRVLHDYGHDTVVYDPAVEGSLSTATKLVHISDMVVVATPPQFQAEMVDLCVEWETPFFCEKPFTLDPIQAAWLATCSREANLQGAAGYIALHADNYPKSAGVLKVDRRTNSAGYHDVSALWDIGVHDVAAFIDLAGLPTTISAETTFDTYHLELSNGRATAELSGSRLGGKSWDWIVDGDYWTPYDSKREPLHTEIGWWLAGGDNLQLAVDTVSTLSQCE